MVGVLSPSIVPFIVEVEKRSILAAYVWSLKESLKKLLSWSAGGNHEWEWDAVSSSPKMNFAKFH